jgi:hypothetical protein
VRISYEGRRGGERRSASPLPLFTGVERIQQARRTDPVRVESNIGRPPERIMIRRGILGPQFFRPELLNRVDDIVVFKALSKDDLRGIVEIQLRRLERLLGCAGATASVEGAEGGLRSVSSGDCAPAGAGSRPPQRSSPP